MVNKNPFKVCYILKRYPRLSETFIVNELQALHDQGINVTIIAHKPAEDKIIHEKAKKLDIPIYYFPSLSSIPEDAWASRYRKNLSSASSLLGREVLKGGFSKKEYRTWIRCAMMAPFIKQLGINHLHAHFATVATETALLLSEMTGIPYSFTAHAKDIYHKKVDNEVLTEKIAKARFVITVSDFNKQYLDALLRSKGKSGKVIRLYNGIDLNQFKASETKKNGHLIVSVGRLVPKKGFRFLIEACNILNKNGHDFQCVIIGEGEERAVLEKQIEKYGLADKVLLIGIQSQTEVIRILQSARACVLPCIIDADGDRDGLPTVLLEAMALGTPVISTRVTGIPEMIADGVSGLLVSEKDPQALADAMTRLLDSEALQKQLSGVALTRVQQDFNLETNVKTLRQYFTHKGRFDANA